MPKLNPYLVKNIDKLPETYTVSYFNEEEWNKDLTPEEILKRDEIAELEYQDRLLNGVKIGPGNDQSKEVAKKIGSVVLATTYFTPLVAVTGPLTIAAGTVGGTMHIVGHATDDDDLKKIGGFMFETALNAGAEGLGAGNLNSGAPLIARGVKTLAQGYNTASGILDIDIAGPMVGARERAQIANHIIKYGF